MPNKKNAKRKDGRIPVQVYLGRGEDGKRKYKMVYGRTQKEADDKADAVKFALSKGIDVINAGAPFNKFIDAWKALKKGDVSAHYLESLNGRIEHIKRYLGDLPTNSIIVSNVQNMINELAENNPTTKKPTAKKTLQDIRNTTIQIFEIAIENRVIDFNPAKYAKIPSKSPQEVRFSLTDQERQWIEDMHHNAQLAAMIMLYSGLRRGELFPLLWMDVDLKNATISVNKSVEIVSGKSIVKRGAKTDAGTRTIDIPDVLVKFLSEKYEADGRNPLMLVCRNQSGNMHSDISFRRMWESYIRDLNFEYGNRLDKKGQLAKSKYNRNGVPITIRKFTPHCLRHTFATMLYHAGVDVLAAKEQLGHSDVKTTLSIYTHLDQIHKRRSMEKLNQYLSGNDASQMQVSGEKKTTP